jgi:hypothetical protein
LEYLKDRFRPELPVKPEILEREKEFNEDDPTRERWILNHTYLCQGGLEALAKHPDFIAAGQHSEHIITHYEPLFRKPAKRVRVSLPLSSDRQTLLDEIERRLKLDLNSRGCNAGVFYRRYEKDNSLYAEAVPATLSSE